jgi:hypothetical protein
MQRVVPKFEEPVRQADEAPPEKLDLRALLKKRFGGR